MGRKDPVPMARAVVCAAGPRMAPLLDIALPGFERYAAVHGYDLVVDRSLDDTAAIDDPHARAAARWHKPALMRRCLDDYHAILWLDADTVICDPTRDIAADVPIGRFQGLVLEQFPDRVNPNTGVWYLRAERRSLAFLDAVLATGQLPHSWADQAAVCALLGWDLGDHHGHGARPLRRTPFRDGTAWLPPWWNVIGAPASRARIRHFAGMPFHERIDGMRAAVDAGR